MTSTFHGLEIGKRSILAQSAALSTTGQNIANANTVGYTRQEAVLQASKPIAGIPSVTNGALGTGVEVSELRRIRSEFLDNQYRNAQADSGYWDAKSSALQSLEGVFNEPSDAGLSTTIDTFWGSFQELSKQPDSLALRTAVIANAQAVASSISGISNGINQVEADLRTDLTSKVSDINSSLKEFASLNQQIAKMNAIGNQPNDLYDQRDMLIDKLSKMMSVSATPGQNGIVILSVGGVAIVNGMVAGALAVNPQTGELTVDNQKVDVTGGELKGILDTLNVNIPSLKDNLNLLSSTISVQLNGLQTGANAKSLDNIQNGTTDKPLFFVDKDDPTKPPTSAGNMIVNPVLLQSPGKLCAAQSNLVGDGTNAKAMAGLQTQAIDINGNSSSITDFYHSMIGKLGLDVQDANKWSANADSVSQQIDNRRQSISGVSIDEEMTNMVRFQQAYNAAAKYVSAVDDMLDKLINGMK